MRRNKFSIRKKWLEKIDKINVNFVLKTLYIKTIFQHNSYISKNITQIAKSNLFS